MPTRTLSRRDFLKTTGLALGTGVVACSGLTALATYRPSVALPESTFGDQDTAKKVLIAYASKCGSTGEVATAIGKTLAQNGAHVDVMPLKEVTDLSGYQAVFVGSAIRVGKWLREAADFVNENRAILQRVPTAYFTVCMTMAEDTPANRDRAAGFIDPVRTVLAPAAEGYFAGKVDFKRLSFVESTMLKAKGGIEGDFRNWDKIKNWAQSTYAQICA
ncbi:menaquinone-dependent protoporphyrinogen oxidase [Anaerolineales bacterium]|nr:menaquinone-dependent protoporphyrinogen oxidase [Anaerolineales bacterium]